MSDEQRGTDWVTRVGEVARVDDRDSTNHNDGAEFTGLSGWAWLGSAFVFPIASARFYRVGIRRGPKSAIVFFLVLGLIAATLLTMRLGGVSVEMDNDVREAYASDRIPSIIIDQGLATVDGPEPALLFDSDGTLVAADTTGVLTEIDRDTYDQGLLLTRDELHYLNARDEYQILPLSQVQELAGGEQLVLDAEGMLVLWQRLRRLITILAGGVMLLWYTLGRLAVVALMALAIWGVAALLRPGARYVSVLTAGLYAAGPALYLNHLLDRMGAGIVAYDLLLLAVVWGIVLLCLGTKFGRKRMRRAGAARPVWAWIGFPLLLFLGLDVVYRWPWAPLWLFLVALLTLVMLDGLPHVLGGSSGTNGQLLE